jgi:hypothetical protein
VDVVWNFTTKTMKNALFKGKRGIMSTYIDIKVNRVIASLTPGKRVIMPKTNEFTPTYIYPMQDSEFACIGTITNSYNRGALHFNVKWDTGHKGVYPYTLLQLIEKEDLPDNPNTGFRMAKRKRPKTQSYKEYKKQITSEAVKRSIEKGIRKISMGYTYDF